MDMIALPKWSPNLITERTGWACAALMNSKTCFAPLPTGTRPSRWINRSNDRVLVMATHDVATESAMITRGFTSRNSGGDRSDRIPPGQHLVEHFPNVTALE
jgi:hypothetical protein